MNNFIVKQADNSDIELFIKESFKLNPYNKIETIIHGSFNYLLLDGEYPVGFASMFRSSKYWSFHMYNINIIKPYESKQSYKMFIEKILEIAHREGGYHINVPCYKDDIILAEALEELGFDITEDSNYSFVLYTIFQPVHHF